MKFLHVTIQTTRFEEEIEFYEKEVGLTLQRDMRPMKDLVFLEADHTGGPNLSIGFKTDDVEAKREELIAKGYQVTPMITPMPDVKFFFVVDPAGVNVQFM